MRHLDWKTVILHYRKADAENTTFTSHWIFDWFCLMERSTTQIFHEYIQTYASMFAMAEFIRDDL